MTTPPLKNNVFFTGIGVLLVFFLALFLASCGAPKKPQKGIFVQKKKIPRKIAVLPVTYAPKEKKEGVSLEVDPESEKGKFVANLARGVIHNQLSGKGYVTQPLDLVDKKLAASKEGKNWNTASPKYLCKILGVDGLIYPEILSATMMKAIAYDEYSIEASIKMVTSSGETLGTWTDSASKRKIALPTSPLSAIAVVLEAALDESERKHMRLIVYDLGWKIAQFVPDSPHGKALPEVISVVTNVDKGTFAGGEQIEVEVTAEKDLTCTFDVGDFKKSIPMPYSEKGTYKGVYQVREGDKTAMAPIRIRMVKPNGVERIWVETAGTVTIDAISPPPPGEVEGVAGRQGVSLSWTLPQTEDLNEFIVEKSDRPVGDFTLLKKTKDLTLLDPEVTQGSTHYYRIKSVDRVGNRSPPTRTIKMTMPFFDQVKLPEQLKGTLVPGVYLVEKEAIVPVGEVANIGPGSRLKFSPNAKLVTKGVLKVMGSNERSAIFEGAGWKGIQVVSGGRAEISHASFNGCSPCIEAKGGGLKIKTATIKGSGGDGIVIGHGTRFDLQDILIGGFQKGIVLDGGRGRIKESNIARNTVGVEFAGGVVELVNNNIFENKEKDVLSHGKLILHDNYLGTASVKEAKLGGDIFVQSLLDAPWPHGRKILLVDKKDITPEVRLARFQKYKEKGVEAFQKRKFGKAHQYLSKALSLKDDTEVYLYMAYTQMLLGEEDKLEKTLEKGIEAFPYEVKLYQIYIKHLAAKGKKKEALSLLEKALKMNPDNETLKIMKQSLVEPPPSPPVKEKTEEKKLPPPPEKEAAPKKDDNDFGKFKARGIEDFKKRKFKEANKNLSKALLLKDDKEVYLYLAFTQMNLGEKEELEKTLDKGIKAFPNQVRLYEIYARHLSTEGQTEKALSLIKKGLKIDPKNTKLEFLKQYLEERQGE
jgi:tetratricopeptide (TPR) repeat protein